MRDGVVLRADIWRDPDDSHPRPVILQRTPYDKQAFDLVFVQMGLDPLRAVEAGYIVMIQDCRGRFRSDGEFQPFVQEYPDGVDTIAWVRDQPWCDGRVGMYGASYVGGTQLMAAAAGPSTGPDVICPHITGSDYWEGWTYQGGAFQLGFIQWWTVAFLSPVSIDRLPETERAEPLAIRDRLIADPWATYERLPATDLSGLERHLPFYRDWLRRETRDDGWRTTAPRSHYPAMATPALHIGGWYDIFIGGTIENYTRLRAEAATPEARESQRLLVGPWAHGNLGDVIGTVEFGLHASEASVDMTDLHLAFFDRHLRAGTDPTRQPAESAVSDPEPRVRLFLMGADTWIDEPDWPVPDVRDESWALHSLGHAVTSAGDGRLRPDEPGAAEPPDRFEYDPHDPVPSIGGASFLPGLGVGLRTGAHDQREIERRPDVLVYTSEALTEDLDVIGVVRAELWVASDAPSTDVTARLTDVHPDGRSIIVVSGILDLRYRDGLDQPADDLRPGQVYRASLTLGPTAMRFRRGHRIRLAVSSSDFPRFARNPNSGGSRVSATPAELRTARQVLYHDARRPSMLILPIRRTGLAVPS
jgi:putative CocE/NonD family hydrolase